MSAYSYCPLTGSVCKTVSSQNFSSRTAPQIPRLNCPQKMTNGNTIFAEQRKNAFSTERDCMQGRGMENK